MHRSIFTRVLTVDAKVTLIQRPPKWRWGPQPLHQFNLAHGSVQYCSTIMAMSVKAKALATAIWMPVGLLFSLKRNTDCSRMPYHPSHPAERLHDVRRRAWSSTCTIPSHPGPFSGPVVSQTGYCAIDSAAMCHNEREVRGDANGSRLGSERDRIGEDFGRTAWSHEVKFFIIFLVVNRILALVDGRATSPEGSWGGKGTYMWRSQTKIKNHSLRNPILLLVRGKWSFQLPLFSIRSAIQRPRYSSPYSYIFYEARWQAWGRHYSIPQGARGGSW